MYNNLQRTHCDMHDAVIHKEARKPSRFPLPLATLLAVCLIIQGCAEDGPIEPLDENPPAAITDLAASNPTHNSIILTWTAPGDDGNSGTASLYDIRYSHSAIADTNWTSSWRIYNEPKPRAAGEAETLLCIDLTADETYYFALKTADEERNWSALSNIASEVTIFDVIPPAAVRDLSATDITQRTVTLHWTSQGDDGDTGTAVQYDIRYYKSPIDVSNWESAMQIDNEPTPKPAGEEESFTITGLYCGAAYYFALKISDENPNWSQLSNVVDFTTLTGCWVPLGHGTPDIFGGVDAFAVYNGRLIAGGGMSLAYDNIVVWDGNAWSTLGSGLVGAIHALTVYDGRLIAGGFITSIGGVPANGIAAWDGNSWAPMGDGMPGIVHALTEYNGELIAAGSFEDCMPGFTCGRDAAGHCRKWNGSRWVGVGGGANPYEEGSATVNALTVYDGRLIAGGSFWIAEGGPSTGIGATNGGLWSELGEWAYTRVLALAIYDDLLIAGGSFPETNYISAWNGSAWSSLGEGMNTHVYAFTIYDGRLIAGGSFTTAGTVSAKRVAAWDGSAWSAFGTGLYGTVAALVVYNNELIAGGEFRYSGIEHSIAVWKE